MPSSEEEVRRAFGLSLDLPLSPAFLDELAAAYRNGDHLRADTSRASISRTQLAEIVSEYTYACPHCPEGQRVWVGLADIDEILRRAGVVIAD